MTDYWDPRFVGEAAEGKAECCLRSCCSLVAEPRLSGFTGYARVWGSQEWVVRERRWHGKKRIQAADSPDAGREGVWSLGRGFREVVGWLSICFYRGQTSGLLNQSSFFLLLHQRVWFLMRFLTSASGQSHIHHSEVSFNWRFLHRYLQP